MGTVVQLEKKIMEIWDGSVAEGVELTVKANTSLNDAYLGCSIAVNGVCLTATSIKNDQVSQGVQFSMHIGNHNLLLVMIEKFSYHLDSLRKHFGAQT